MGIGPPGEMEEGPAIGRALIGGVTILSHSFRFGGLSGRTRTYGLLLPTQACHRLHHTQSTRLDYHRVVRSFCEIFP